MDESKGFVHVKRSGSPPVVSLTLGSKIQLDRDFCIGRLRMLCQHTLWRSSMDSRTTLNSLCFRGLLWKSQQLRRGLGGAAALKGRAAQTWVCANLALSVHGRQAESCSPTCFSRDGNQLTPRKNLHTLPEGRRCPHGCSVMNP
jgi:hypothetical protein